jgi:hypothetical protein
VCIDHEQTISRIGRHLQVYFSVLGAVLDNYTFYYDLGLPWGCLVLFRARSWDRKEDHIGSSSLDGDMAVEQLLGIT